MDDKAFQQRLSQISTAWTMVFRAHQDDQASLTAAQAALVNRYRSAVYRYLLAAVRDQDTADDLFQDFALRLVRGDFGRADQSRGRFRDYVKSALINLVINHQKKQRRMAAMPDALEPAYENHTAPDLDREFLIDWRKSLLERAWETLASAQEPGSPPFYHVLRLRCENPEWSVTQLAVRVSEHVAAAEPFTDAGIRKILQRAREKFTDLLVDEVAASIQSSNLEAIEQELIDLGFQAYCRRALERRKMQLA